MTSLSATPRRRLQHKAFLAKWSKVDWSKQNVELVAETGLSRERIRQIRQQVGAPKSPHHRRQRKTAEALQWAKNNLDKLKGLCAAELEQKYGLSRNRRSSLYRFLKPFLRNGLLIKKHRWDLMNFELPNRDLQRIWRLPLNMVAAYRYRNQLPPSRWYFGRGPRYTKLSKPGQIQAYQRAVKAEKRKAAKYFAQAKVVARKHSPAKKSGSSLEMKGP